MITFAGTGRRTGAGATTGAATTTVAGPAAARRVAVVDEPLVGLGDHAARHAQLGRQHPGRGEAAADRQPAVGDRGTQLPGEPVRKAARRRGPDVELQEVG